MYGYRKLAKANAKLLELVELDAPLPPHEYETRGLWIELPSRLKGDLARRGHEAYARGALHAIEHLCIALAPLVVMCDHSDLGCQCTRRAGDAHAERLLLFGGGAAHRRRRAAQPAAAPAGRGSRASRRGCDRAARRACCSRMRRYNEGLDKGGAALLLRWMVRGEEIEEPGGKPCEAAS